MITRLASLLALLVLMLPAVAQDQKAAPDREQGGTPVVVERGPNHKVWQTVSRRVTSFGREHFVTNSYTELRTGMHYN